MTLPLDRVLQQASPVLPVLVIEDVALAPDLARALYAGGVTVLEADGLRLQPSSVLYSEDAPAQTLVTLRAIPYYAWSNRSAGEMTVWIQEA